MLVGFCWDRFIHHPQHFRATGFQETPYQERSQAKEHDVEPSRVIPCDVSLYNVSHRGVGSDHARRQST
jgi:hypothetical protein